MSSIEQTQVFEATEMRGEAAAEEAQARTASTKRAVARDATLDIVKGICVLVMVLYHGQEYFPDSPLDMQRLGFVTGAFIFLAGFVVTHIYLQKYDVRTQGAEILRLLVVRGLKLILIAALLNLVIRGLLGAGGWKQGSHQLGTLYYNMLTGADYHGASFILLVIIGYSLMAAGIVVALSRGHRLVMVAFAGLTLTYALISNHFHWPYDYDVRLFATGQVGLVFGLLDRTTIAKFCGNLENVVLIYIAQLLLILVLPWGYWLYLVNLMCTLLMIFAVAYKCNQESFVSRKLILLGRYSLLSYLFQIAFLQCMRRVTRDVTDEWVLVMIALTAAATLVCAEVTDRLKKKSKVVNQTYKWIFS